MYRTKKTIKRYKEKGQVIYEGTPIRIIPDFLPETLKARMIWEDILQTLRDHMSVLTITPSKTFNPYIERKNKRIPDKTNLNNINPKIQTYRRYLKENSNQQRLTKHRKKEEINK